MLPAERVYSVLLVSAAEKVNNALLPLFRGGSFDPVTVVDTIAKAQRRLSDRDYDLVIAQINGHPYEQKIIEKQFHKLIEKNGLRPVVFHSLRHSSTSLKLKLSRGNIKAVQGDTGHAEARMVTDTYAHGFDADRKLIAKEMDSGFFAKVGAEDRAETAEPTADEETLAMLKRLVRQRPELLTELLKESGGEQ